MLASEVEHLVFVEELALVTELVAEVAEQGGGLITDLARAQRLRHLRQFFQLSADANPIGGRGGRHPAEAADPGDNSCVPVSDVGSSLLDMASRGGEVAFERIDDSAI